MNIINWYKKGLRKIDMLDIAMIKTVSLIFGIIIATYLSFVRGFVEQNILVVIFVLVVISIRPVIRFLKR